MIDNTKTSKLFVDLVNIVEKLRSPEGCPWDKEQTHESLLPYFLEEVYEVIESVELKDWETLKEELGDVLLHILLQAKIADETNKFNISDSLEGINNKLVNRHPHVFGDDNIDASGEAKQNWEDIKHVEKKRKSRLDGVPNKLPALVRAQRLQEKASHAGFDWDNIDDAWEKLNEELNELKSAQEKRDIENIKEEIGDVLFSVVNLSRFFDIPAEDMLRKTNRKFITRFQTIERELKEKGKKLENSNLEEMEKIWEKSKG
jgi:tetrapyrrole methylase family protein/MazG family protein